MFLEKSFTNKTIEMIVPLVVHRKDIKKQKIKIKKKTLFCSKDRFDIKNNRKDCIIWLTQRRHEETKLEKNICSLEIGFLIKLYQ